jgi:hypothetical protein
MGKFTSKILSKTKELLIFGRELDFDFAKVSYIFSNRIIRLKLSNRQLFMGLNKGIDKIRFENPLKNFSFR